MGSSGQFLAPSGPADCGLSSWEIEQHHVRAFLYSFKNNVMAIRGDVEVANVKVGREVGQLALSAGLQVDQPEILVLNLAP